MTYIDHQKGGNKMTVQELIEKLLKVEDKSKEVYIGVEKESTPDFDVYEEKDSVCLYDWWTIRCVKPIFKGGLNNESNHRPQQSINSIRSRR